MCSIIGWMGEIPDVTKSHLLHTANERGRDGYGFSIQNEGQEEVIIRSIDHMTNLDFMSIFGAGKMLGNFRATPTTEAESKIEYLQPYDSIIHNGIIANDKKYGDYPIDSMVLPKIFKQRSARKTLRNVSKIKGSYALAWFDWVNNNKLILTRNYKPIYYWQSENGIVFASTPDMINLPSTPTDAYSVTELGFNYYKKVYYIKREQSNKVIVSASSGLDSTVVAYDLKNKGYDVTLAHMIYGCLAEDNEINRIKKIAKHGGFELEFIHMPNVMTGSITEGNYHKDKIAGTEYAMDWVSGRNLLMLSILTAWAETKKFGYIAFGGNLEESGAYPDNEQEFGRMFNNILPYATQNGIKIELLQPVSTLMKHEIVKLGNKLNVPWELTWSCYSNKEKHCNNCAPCFMRKTAFERNGLKDPVF